MNVRYIVLFKLFHLFSKLHLELFAYITLLKISIFKKCMRIHNLSIILIIKCWVIFLRFLLNSFPLKTFTEYFPKKILFIQKLNHLMNDLYCIQCYQTIYTVLIFVFIELRSYLCVKFTVGKNK